MEWSGAWTGLKTLLVAMAILAVMAGWAWAGHGKSKTAEAKTGIVLVAFGSTVAEARVAYAEIEKAVAAACPGLERVWAYSSDQVRTKLAKEGIAVPSPAEALARLAARGFDRAVVLPLMVIPGEEFHALAQVCGRFQGMAKGLSRIVLADPLLASSADAERLTTILAATPRDDDEALVLMGHGSPHGADLCYPALQYFFSKTNSSILVGTVEGTPSLDDVLAELRARKTAKAVLRPLMTVAGDHARNDMAGPEEDSWVSVLSQAGIACRPLLQGLGSDPKVVALWVEHLKRAMKSLEF